MVSGIEEVKHVQTKTACIADPHDREELSFISLSEGLCHRLVEDKGRDETKIH